MARRPEADKIKSSEEAINQHYHDDGIDCPTCKKGGHEHKMKFTDKGTIKCTGEGCNTEYVNLGKIKENLLKDAEGECVDCGSPVVEKAHGSKGTCTICGSTNVKW